MKHLLLFEAFDTESHLKQRGVDTNKTRVIIDKDSGDTFFFLYNLTGQMVGYQKYNPAYPKKGQRDLGDAKITKYYNWIGDEQDGKKIAVWGLESYDTGSKYLFITEGIFDIARVHESGYPGIAVLGNDPSPQLSFWLKTLPQTKIVIYDNDVAGKKLIKFGDYAFSVEGAKDLNDLSPEEAKIFLDNIIKTIGDEVH
jgi:DNA primase